MWKKTLVAASLIVGLAGTAQASVTFGFDPTGTSSYSVTGSAIDWLYGNALSVGGTPAGGLTTGTTSQLLYQANMGSITNAGAIQYTSGSDGNFFTVVAGFYETATVVNTATTSTALFTQAAGTSFFNVYAGGVAGNNLTGANFTSSNLVLSGTLSNLASGTFTAQTATAPQLLDQSGGDDWSGTQTLTGAGATLLEWLVTYSNPNYFDLDLTNYIITASINTSLVVPFREVDPSRAFSSDGVTSANHVANIGAVNAVADGTNRDFIVQADGNNSFIQRTVPEPGMLAMIGLGLGVLGLMRRRTMVAA